MVSVSHALATNTQIINNVELQLQVTTNTSHKTGWHHHHLECICRHTQLYLRFVKIKLMRISHKPQCNWEVSRRQMCWKFPFRWIDRRAGQRERARRWVAAHRGPSLDCVSIVVQMYHPVRWLQRGEDTGHYTRRGFHFLCRMEGSLSAGENWHAAHKSSLSSLKRDTLTDSVIVHGRGVPTKTRAN